MFEVKLPQWTGQYFCWFQEIALDSVVSKQVFPLKVLLYDFK